jgi:hypothetical protein
VVPVAATADAAAADRASYTSAQPCFEKQPLDQLVLVDGEAA